MVRKKQEKLLVGEVLTTGQFSKMCRSLEKLEVIDREVVLYNLLEFMIEQDKKQKT